jgi:hypothetical protein
MSSAVCIMYTDDTITQKQLLEMEFIIMTYFEWNIMSTTAVDLVQSILVKLEFEGNFFKNMLMKVQALIDLCLIGK